MAGSREGRAGTGVEINLDLVPQRETGMTAYEMMLSESQERMLIVAERGHDRQVLEIFHRWDLDAVIIGHGVGAGSAVSSGTGSCCCSGTMAPLLSPRTSGL